MASEDDISLATQVLVIKRGVSMNLFNPARPLCLDFYLISIVIYFVFWRLRWARIVLHVVFDCHCLISIDKTLLLYLHLFTSVQIRIWSHIHYYLWPMLLNWFIFYFSVYKTTTKLDNDLDSVDFLLSDEESSDLEIFNPKKQDIKGLDSGKVMLN